METEKRATMNTIWNRSVSKMVPLAITVVANTMEAAPRKPAQDTSRHRDKLLFKGLRIRNTAIGRASIVKKNTIARDGSRIAGNL